MAGRQSSTRRDDVSPTKLKHGSIKNGRGPRSSSISASTRRASNQSGRGGKLPHAVRRSRSGCYNPEVRKGIGAVLFALAVPTAVAGIVMAVVAATDDDQNGKYPPAFSAVGPVLLVCAFLLFLTGFSMLSPIIPTAVEHCLSFDNPNSFCRVHCPKLSHFLKPDPTITINRAAMDALKVEPGKSVLKKPTGPPVREYDVPEPFVQMSLPEEISNGIEDNAQPIQRPEASDITQMTVLSEIKGRRAGLKGVRFSEGVISEGPHRTRTVSTSSDSSLLSLRHCKIYPKDETDIWRTDIHIVEKFQNCVGEQMTTEL
ncbi:hypothetical protein PoB_006590900 [Plakobranchus ocellatus]|uniref:Uncharacterized protein n=1 Tax=Plakobranchus ocellatus TaxID=259542 RepID=A0AAV4D5I1_9GAST|nr:hypothetical protein PoB_006590900 [Plakobranchus ocellatus]